MLWMYQRVFWGPPRKAAAHGVPDLDVREWFTIAPLLIAIVWIGFFPQPLLSVVKEPVDAFVSRVARAEPLKPRAQAPAPSHCPSRPQVDADSWVQSPSGSVPPVTGRQRPSGWPVLAFEHAVHPAVHVDSQQTPSTQLALAHSPAAAQVAPPAFNGTQTVPAQ